MVKRRQAISKYPTPTYSKSYEILTYLDFFSWNIVSRLAVAANQTEPFRFRSMLGHAAPKVQCGGWKILLDQEALAKQRTHVTMQLPELCSIKTYCSGFERGRSHSV